MRKNSFTLFEVLIAFFLGSFLFGALFWSIRLYTEVEKAFHSKAHEEEQERLFSYLLPLYSQMIERKSAKERALRTFLAEEDLFVVAWSCQWLADRDPLFMGSVDCVLEYNKIARTLLLKMVGQQIKDQPAPVKKLYFKEGIEDFRVRFHQFRGRIGEKKEPYLLWEDQWPLSRAVDPDLVAVQFSLEGEPVELFFMLPAFEKAPLLIKAAPLALHK